MAERDKIKTNQVADLLEVSRATAFRYLEELEKEGKIEQINAFGRNVRYRLKNLMLQSTLEALKSVTVTKNKRWESQIDKRE